MITLESILKRNNSNILLFCTKNRLTSYDSLLKYCEQRNFIPCTEKEYEEVIKKNEPKKKPSRKNSKTQNKRKPRNSNKGKSSAPKISKSVNKGKDWRMDKLLCY